MRNVAILPWTSLPVASTFIEILFYQLSWIFKDLFFNYNAHNSHTTVYKEINDSSVSSRLVVDALRNSEIILLTLHVVSVLISFLKGKQKENF